MQSALAVDRSHERSVVTTARAYPPLRLLAPRGGGHAAWVYQSSLGGGFVGDDRVALRVRVGDRASLFLSTQASSKVYRRARSRSELDAEVGDGGLLVAWPDPVTCFAGAAFEQHQRFALAASASLLVVDAWTAGRVARGERYRFARLAMRLSVAIAGVPVLDDALLLSPAHGDLAQRLGDCDAFATVVIAGALPWRELVAAIAELPASRRPWISASAWPWGAVVRIAASDSEALATELQRLRPIASDALGADPWARKW